MFPEKLDRSKKECVVELNIGATTETKVDSEIGETLIGL
jgi:hypothetical protein